MPPGLAPTVRVELLRPTLIVGIDGRQEGETGDIFEVSRYQASMLVSDGAAREVNEHARTAVTLITPEHGDPAPRRVSSGPPKVNKD